MRGWLHDRATCDTCLSNVRQRFSTTLNTGTFIWSAAGETGVVQLEPSNGSGGHNMTDAIACSWFTGTDIGLVP